MYGGTFANQVVSFLLVAVAVFVLVRAVNRLRREEPEAAPEPTSRSCPYCAMDIPRAAVRCPHCTSELRATS